MWIRRFQRSLVAGGLGLGMVGSAIAPSQAQTTNYAECQPPQGQEPLVLVVAPTAEGQQRVRRAIPAKLAATPCRYLKDVVVRVSGFETDSEASSWARYVYDNLALPAFIARSPEVTSSEAPAEDQDYGPRSLPTGYVVLVEYFSQPETATRLAQTTNSPVGLAVYGQKPYLLASSTRDQQAAMELLQRLTRQGFWPILVDSSRVVVLTAEVAEQSATSAAEPPETSEPADSPAP